MTDLTNVETHFRFGENWTRYLKHVDDEALENARNALLRLIPADRFAGATLIDIGCGSGIHAVAASTLGAEVTAIDIDPDSVSATRKLVAKCGARVTAEQVSVFDAKGQFDIVYSWGVLHHTGDMWRAIDAAARLVRPGGLFAIALYQKTPACGRWAKIKAMYSNAAVPVQWAMRSLYTAAHIVRLTATGTNPVRHVREYKSGRGMNFFTDIHDWLGGHPYESASPEEIIGFFDRLGFELVMDGRLPEGRGVFGTGCAEFTFRR